MRKSGMSQDEACSPSSPEMASSSSGSGKQEELSVEDDELYCLNTALVYIQVQQKLFYVPTYRFSDESHVFAGMFNLPQSKSTDSEGFSRTNPIVLPQDITSRDFQNFLKALYPRSISIRLKLTTEEWISTLRLATYWYFLNVRKMAITEIEETKALASSSKIVYGREFKIESWVLSGMFELVKRKETISNDEAREVTFETAFFLSRIREKRLAKPGDLLMVFDENNSLKKIIREEFREELETILQYEKEYGIEEELVPLDLPTELAADEVTSHPAAPGGEELESPPGWGTLPGTLTGSDLHFQKAELEAIPTLNWAFPSSSSYKTSGKKKIKRKQ